MSPISFVNFAEIGAALMVLTSFRRRDRNLDALIAAGLIAAAAASLPLMTAASGALNPTFDAVFLKADRLIGLDTAPLAQACYSIPWLWKLVATSYAALPLMIAIAWTMERSRKLVRTALIAAAFAPACYLMFPGAGPAAAVTGFPWSDPAGAWALRSVAGGGARNAFPSLHFAWALLTFTNARSRQMKALGFVFALTTAIATMGSGEHYAVDLIASVPFVAAVHFVAEWSKGFRISGGAGKGVKPAGRVLPPAASASLAPVAGTPANRPLPARGIMGRPEKRNSFDDLLEAISGGRFVFAAGVFGRIETLLDAFTPRERAVVRFLFGTPAQPGTTVAECAKEYGVTQARIRNIVYKAVRKMRHPARAPFLYGKSGLCRQDLKRLSEKEQRR